MEGKKAKITRFFYVLYYVFCFLTSFVGFSFTNIAYGVVPVLAYIVSYLSFSGDYAGWKQRNVCDISLSLLHITIFPLFTSWGVCEIVKKFFSAKQHITIFLFVILYVIMQFLSIYFKAKAYPAAFGLLESEESKK